MEVWNYFLYHPHLFLDTWKFQTKNGQNNVLSCEFTTARHLKVNLNMWSTDYDDYLSRNDCELTGRIFIALWSNASIKISTHLWSFSVIQAPHLWNLRMKEWDTNIFAWKGVLREYKTVGLDGIESYKNNWAIRKNFR